MRVRYTTRTYDIRRPPQPPELPAETTFRVHPTATGTTATADNNKKLLLYFFFSNPALSFCALKRINNDDGRIFLFL